MTKEFIPYEQALELKELGFEAAPLGSFKQDAVFYYEKGELYYDHRPMYSSTAHKGQILAPLYQQAFRWFRDKYNLYQHIEHIGASNEYQWHIKHRWDTFKTYEEAELACLKKLIEIVKNK